MITRLLHLGSASVVALITQAQFGPPNFIVGNRIDDPQEVHAADFNGDGVMDLLCLSRFDIFGHQHRVSWYAGEGNGTFSYQHPIAGPASPALTGAVADIDEDGDMDVMVGYGSDNSFGWFANDGSGTFGPFQLVHIASDDPTVLYLVDLNNDAHLDLLVHLTSGTTDDVFWKAGNGDGTFQNSMNMWNSSIYTINTIPVDLDGDNDLDLLWTVTGGIRKRVNNGDGTFAASQDILLVANVSGSCAADLDGDSDVDIALLISGTSILLLRNNGDGTFALATTLASGLSAVTAMYASDADGDGDADLFTAHNNKEVAITRSLGNGSFAARSVIGARYAPPSDLRLADVDGDGDLDLMATFQADDRMGYFSNTGNGSFEQDPILVQEHLRGIGRIQCVDLDQDGVNDLVVPSTWWDQISWFRNDGTPNFAPVRDVRRGVVNPSDLLSLDVDGDGDNDLIVASSTADTVMRLSCTGPGSFAPPQFIGGPVDAPMDLNWCNIDNDGHADILMSAASGSSQVMRWYRGLGGGSFQASTINGYDYTLRQPQAADLDNDGDQDVMRIGSSPALGWHVNSGNNTFAQQPEVIVANSFAVRTFRLDDVDGDGDIDIVAGILQNGLDHIIWMPNEGGGLFFTWNTLAYDMPTTSVMRLFDYDLDGDKDIFVGANSPETVYFLRSNGDGTFEDTLTIAGDIFQIITDLTLADLDGDNKPDLAVAGSDDGSVAWFKNENDLPVEVQYANERGSCFTVITNPVVNRLRLRLCNAFVDASVEIIDLQGRSIKTVPAVTTENLLIDVADLVPGSYMIRLWTHGYTQVRKICVQR
ncbi:MAG: T9SS type A sorting domain-containing protein [Flavobacteriales bacterium]|nr:T9SS type A sorting domain-containing protein [Flavobacteriales bacterium]